MATLTIRNLNEETKIKLRQLAAKNGHSMEEEVRQILNRSVNQPERYGLGTEIVNLFAGIVGDELKMPARSIPRPVPNFLNEPA